LTGHTDPLVDLAARSLFRAALREGAKSYRVPPRPGGEGRRGVQIPASDVNDLLYKAANGELNSSEALVDFLTEALGDFVKFSFGWMYASLGRFNPGRSAEVHGFVYYGFHMESPDIIPYIKCLCYLIRQNAPLEDRRRGLSPEYGRKRCPAEHDPEKLEAEADYNTRVRDQFYAACREYRLGPLRKWLLVYVQDRRALCNSVYTEAFRQADQALQKAAMAGSWWKLFKWRGGLDERGWRYASLSGTANSWYTHYVETTAAISLLRDRLRWLLVLCDGVSRDPILVTSGEQEPRRRPHHIVHSRQNQQDALDEFAGKLVHPPERYVAHVRMPLTYHRVKLAVPLAMTDPAIQVDEVRRRSQEGYHTPGLRGDPEPPPRQQAPGAERRRITRRPRVDGPESPEEPSLEGEWRETS
jgi:hypothetical protein